MAMMLNVLQLGICCSVVQGAIYNLYFNFYKYFPEANKLNQQAFLEMTDEERKNIVANMTKLPVPFIGALCGMFSSNITNFPDSGDITRWEAFSPVASAEMLSNPVLMTHATSDLLVPIDQLSKRFTYTKPGTSLPEDYFYRLPKDFAGLLKYSMEERLPKNQTAVQCMTAADPDADYQLPFDETKRFNIVIYDEGPIESYGSHRTLPGTGVSYDTEYLECMFQKKACATNILSIGKLKSLIDRFRGVSIQLPPRIGIDDEVYGSLAVYRKEVVDALLKWSKDNGKHKLYLLFDDLLSKEKDSASYNEYQKAINTLQPLLKG